MADLFDDFAEEQDAGTARDSGASLFDGFAQEQDQRQAGQDQRLRLMFERGMMKAPDERAGILELTRQSRIPADVVEQKYPEFKQRAVAAAFDPARFRQENPDLYQLLLESPEAGQVALADPKAPGLIRLLTESVKVGLGSKNAGALGLSEEGQASRKAIIQARLKRQISLEEMNRQLRENEQATGARQVQIVDPSADMSWWGKIVGRYTPMPKDRAEVEKLAAEGKGTGYQPGVLGSSYKQGALTVDRATLGREWSMRVLKGEDTWDLDKRIVDLENRMTPRSYGDDALSTILAATGTLLPSQVETYKGAGPGAAIGAGVGAVVGKVTGVGAKKGAAVGYKAGGFAGGWLTSFRLEQGNAALDYRESTTDAGAPVDPGVAVGWSIVYGGAAATVEVATEFGPVLRSLGPVGDMIRNGTLKAEGKRLLKDRAFRTILADVARRYAGGVHGEAQEEFVQQIIQDALGYIARSQTAGSAQSADVVGAVENATDAYVQAGLGSLLPGAGGAGLNLTAQVQQQQAAQRGQQQLRAIATGAESPTAQASPDFYARMVEGATERTGEKVTAFYVDPSSLTALYQDEATTSAGILSEELEQAATDLMGPEGPRRLQEALATGQKIEVPIAEFAERWRGKPIAEAIADHVSAQPFLPTASEAAEQATRREAEAKAIIDAIEKDEQPVSPAEAPLERLAQELVQVGRMKSGEVQTNVKTWRKFLNSMAARSGLKLERLVQDFVVTVQSAQGQPAEFAQGPVAADLVAAYQALSPDEQRRAFFVDRGTGLLGERALTALPADPARPLVAHLSIEGTKWANRAGHEAGNRYYQLAARAIARVAPEASPAKVGGDFALLVADETEAQGIAEQVQAAIREELGGAGGPEVTVATTARGEMPMAAYAAAGKLNAAEKQRREGGTRAKRGERPLGLAALSGPEDLQLPARAVEGMALPAALAAQDVAERGAEVYVDRSGLLSREGFLASPAKAYTAALDLNGLGRINKLLGDAAGDALLATFAKAAQATGGQVLYFAHFSGDEFALKGDDPVLLQRYIDVLADVCDDVDVPGGQGISFGYGIGADYDAADKLIEASKQRGVEAERAARAARSEDRRRGGLQEGRAPDTGGVRGALREGVAGGVPAGGRETRPDAVPVGPSFWSAVRDQARAQIEALREKHSDQAETFPEYWKAQENLARAEAALDASRLEQSAGGPRGWTTRIQEGLRNLFRVVLTDKADASTFIHESGHVFMDILGELASRQGAPAQLVADWNATLAFTGAKDLAELQDRRQRAAEIRRAAAEAGRELTDAEKDQVRELVAPFEKWARGFERYLMEGKAPSLELAGAFQRFKLWLRAIYGQVSALGVDLNDEIRGVFDRLLATDDEIARAREQMGPTQLFRSPEEAGLQDRPEEWKAYLERAEKAVSASQQAAQQRAAAERLRVTEAWWKEARQERLDDALQAYDALPAVVALRFLRKGDPSRNAALAALGRVKLDRASVLAIISEEEAKKLRGLLVTEGGLHPDQLAELVASGREYSGEQLGRDMVKLQPRTEWAKVQADERMAREFPDVQTERERLQDIASRELHGDAMLTWFLHEQQVLRQRLAEATGRRLQDLGAGAAGIPAESVRRAAEIMVGRMTLEKLDLGHFQGAERQAAERAAVAAAKGDFGQALVHLQQRLLNFFAVRQLQDAREVRDGLENLGSDLGKDKARARLGQGSLAIRDGVDRILEALGLAGPFQHDQPLGSLEAAVDAVDAAGVTVMFDADELGRVLAAPPKVARRYSAGPAPAWRGLTVAQARNVLAALKNMHSAATSNRTALVDGKRVDFEELVGHLVEEAAQNLPDQGPPTSSTQAGSLLQVAGGLVSGMDGELLREETMLDWLGGKSIESWWFRAVVKPLQDAKHLEADLLRETVKPILDAMEKIPASVKRHMRDAVDGKALFPTHTGIIEAPSRRYELISLALNAGNESSLLRLLEARQITRDQLMKALGLLTREELEYVQAVGTAIEGLWPLSRDLEERLAGLAPPKIEAKPFTVVLQDGSQVSLSGWYFPAVYDRRVDVKGELQADDVRRGVDFLDPGFIRPGTAHSHLKSRVEGTTGIISLDPTIIQSHVVQVAHDLAFREAVLSAGKIFLDKRVQETLRRRLGEKRAAVFLDWVKDIGRSRAAQAVSQARTMTRIATRLKSNMAVGALGYAADVIAGDLTNPAVAAIFFKDPRHLAAGIAECVRAPLETRAWALEKSGELRSRADEMIRRFRSNRNELTKRRFPGREAFDFYIDHAFSLFEWSDAFTATPVWVGAYREGLKTFEGDDAKAVTYADKLVRDTFPAQSVVDMAAIQRDKGLLGASMLFFGYLNTIYNRRRDIAHDAFVAFHEPDVTGPGRAAAIARVAWKWVALVAVYQVLGEWLSGRGQEPDEKYWQWLLRKALVGLTFNDVPFGSIAEPLVTKIATGKARKVSARNAPAVAVVQGAAESLSKALEGKGDAKTFFQVARSLGLFFGVPTRPLRAAEYLTTGAASDIEHGRVNELPAGVIYGERKGQPANPLRPAPSKQ